MHTATRFPAPSISASQPAANGEWALTLLGPSICMSQLWGQVRRLAPYIRTALLIGPAEAGQEAVARLMLDLSSNSRRPFLVLSPGSAEDRLGVSSPSIPTEAFLFLPEVEKLSPGAQDNLLRLLRTRRPRALSVVAASSTDLRSEVSLGRFSAELADILTSVRIAVPSLHDRSDDIPMLLAQLIGLRCQAMDCPVPRISEDLLRAAIQHPWPGNLGELSAVVDRMLDQAIPGTELNAEFLRHALQQPTPEVVFPSNVRMIKLDTVVHEHILAVLRACSGNKLRAAEILGISRSTLYRILETAQKDIALPLAS